MVEMCLIFRMSFRAVSSLTCSRLKSYTYGRHTRNFMIFSSTPYIKKIHIGPSILEAGNRRGIKQGISEPGPGTSQSERETSSIELVVTRPCRNCTTEYYYQPD